MPGPDDAVVSRDEHNRLWKNYNNLHAQLLKLQEQVETLSRLRGGCRTHGLAIAEVTGAPAGLATNCSSIKEPPTAFARAAM